MWFQTPPTKLRWIFDPQVSRVLNSRYNENYPSKSDKKKKKRKKIYSYDIDILFFHILFEARWMENEMHRINRGTVFSVWVACYQTVLRPTPTSYLWKRVIPYIPANLGFLYGKSYKWEYGHALVGQGKTTAV